MAGSRCRICRGKGGPLWCSSMPEATDTPVSLRLLNGDLLLRARFSEPQFGLWAPERMAQSSAALYRRLAPFGLEARQLAIQNRSSFTESFLEAPLFGFTLFARLSIQQLEVQAIGSSAKERARAFSVAMACEAAVADAIPGHRWSAITLGVAFHARSDIKTLDVISRFTKAGPSLGEQIAAGVWHSFVLGDMDRSMALATCRLEPSNLVQDGVFFGVQMEWPSSTIGAVEASAEAFLGLALSRYCLKLEA